MVKEKLLKELGWSEELIEEVTRVSKEVEEVAKKSRGVGNKISLRTVASGDSLYISSDNTNTGSHLKITQK